MYLETKRKIQEKLKKDYHIIPISFSIVLGTDPFRNISYLSISAHVIDSEQFKNYFFMFG